MSDQGNQSGHAKWWIGAVIVPVVVGIPAWLALGNDRPPQDAPVPTATSAPPATPNRSTAPPTSPALDPAQPPSVFLSKLSGPQGTKVSVSGEHFAAGEEIVVSFHVVEVGRTRANAAGAFTIEITVPDNYSDFAPKDFAIRANGRSSVKFASAQFRLTG